MKTYTLSRGDSRRMIRNQPEVAEEIAAHAYGYDPLKGNGFDAGRDSGAAIEVKSTVTRMSNGKRGRFRLWENQHAKLTRKDRNGSARYVFVLFDVSSNPPVAKMKMKTPAEIGNKIAGRGGFHKSGHPKGKQHKLPYSTLF